MGRLLAQRGIQDQAAADDFLKAPLTGVHDLELLPNITEVTRHACGVGQHGGAPFGSTAITTPTESPAPPSWPACSGNSGRKLRSRSTFPIG